jgi:hypothetical protein
MGVPRPVRVDVELRKKLRDLFVITKEATRDSVF